MKNSSSLICLYPSQTAAAAAAKTCQSYPTLCDPIDRSPPGSSVPGILQARTLEWVAISFSNAWEWKVKVKSLSHVRLPATPWTVAYQAPLPIGFFQARVLEWGAIAFTDWAYFKSQGKCLIRIPINCIKNQIKHGSITLWIFFELHTHIMYIFPCIFSSSIKIFTIVLQYQEKKIRNWCTDINNYFN